MPVPEAYFDFVMDYAPYLYVNPQSGPDLSWGKAAFSAAFAVDFLYEAYSNAQFDTRSAEIEEKIAELADFIISQQVTDNQKQAYGGFLSSETSTACYSVDACRVLPALLKAYELTTNASYLASAKLAAGTFLFNMQHNPSQLGVHDQFYGGFARAVTLEDAWLSQMDVEALYGLIGLKMLCESDPTNRELYQGMIGDAVDFYRDGLEGLQLYFDPKPDGDGQWHRTGVGEDQVYDDSIAYALLGFYDNEGYSPTVQKTYQALTAISANQIYPAYNPAICWAGYLNVQAKTPACDYYDSVSAGILAKIREGYDKISYSHSANIILANAEAFMFWGAKHADLAYVEVKQAMATVCWLGQFLLDFQAPVTRFTQVLASKGETLTLFSITKAGDSQSFGAGVDLKAVVVPQRAENILLEPGYVVDDYVILHVFAPVRRMDRICRNGVDYEVVSVQDFVFQNQPAFIKAALRRLHNQ
ncbi:MAG: hypothetical protein NWF01_09940 [Candidatus Bathyarchaeota archaeon]|nr:hypothetical protein [Candidatus Bathyarchaeota archaeon]